MNRIEIQNCNDRTDAYDVIIDNGFKDTLPDMNDFYEKVFQKEGKYYFFDGWNCRIRNHKIVRRISVYMREREY